jgi:hypothetical protein
MIASTTSLKAPQLSKYGSVTFTGAVTAKSIEATQYCDQFPGADFGAQVTNCIAALPTLGGFKAGKVSLLGFAGTAQTQSTTVTITSPYVNVEGPGSSALQITCTMNADCWNVRTNPFGINIAGKIGGFTLIGQGSANANANGIHTGDMVGGEFYDLQIDNFLGTNSSCFWVDNTLGWFERNKIDRAEIGIHQATQNGCTKLVRFTFSGAGSNSFGYNAWTNLRMSVIAATTGFSLETGSLYNNFIQGNANVQAASTLFSIPGTNTSGNRGNVFAFQAECTACIANATGINIGAGANLGFTGYFNESNFIVDTGTSAEVTLPGTSSGSHRFVYGTAFNPSGGLGSTITTSMENPPAGSSPIGAWMQRYEASANGFQTGFSHNLFFDGANWRTNTDGGNNGAMGIFGAISPAGMNFYVVPSTGGTSQSITNANLTANNLQATLDTTGFKFATSGGGSRLPATQTIASGTAAMTTAAITGPNCGTTVTVAATGVLTADVIIATDNAAPAATTNGPLTIKAWPTANNVNFAYCVQSGTFTPVAATLNWRVTR